jgi:hypothetical protein
MICVGFLLGVVRFVFVEVEVGSELVAECHRMDRPLL